MRVVIAAFAFGMSLGGTVLAQDEGKPPEWDFYHNQIPPIPSDIHKVFDLQQCLAKGAVHNLPTRDQCFHAYYVQTHCGKLKPGGECAQFYGNAPCRDQSGKVVKCGPKPK